MQGPRVTLARQDGAFDNGKEEQTMTKRILTLISAGALCMALSGCPQNTDPPGDPRLGEGPRTDDARLDEPGRQDAVPGQVNPAVPAPSEDPAQTDQTRDRELEQSIRRPNRDSF
jgi:hypothetical protein